jgi:hypothetical protein
MAIALVFHFHTKNDFVKYDNQTSRKVKISYKYIEIF